VILQLLTEFSPLEVSNSMSIQKPSTLEVTLLPIRRTWGQRFVRSVLGGGRTRPRPRRGLLIYLETFVMHDPSKLESQFASRQLVADFVESFGATRAAKYLAAGLNFVQASSEHAQFLMAENERLRRVLMFRQSAESTPLSQGGGDLAIPTKRAGLASKIRGRSL
jgi:hypothetical protein